jgi:uncharacterized membrane protein
VATIDVSAEIDISASPADIAGVMFDPAREPEWMKAVTAVELIDPALERGARVRRSGTFLGQTLSWTTTVDVVHFPHVLALRILEGPFLGSIRYDIQRSGAGSRVRVRTAGEVALPSFAPVALVAEPMRAALGADLERLKTIVERPQADAAR